MIRQSLLLDLRLLRIASLPFRVRVQLLVTKYLAVLQLCTGRSASWSLPGNTVDVDSLSALGTMQSAIVDVYEDVVAPQLDLPYDPVIVDVGANVGQFANACKVFFPGATIHCFEPQPQSYELLSRNTRRLQSVTLHNVGLSDQTGELPFYEHPLSLMSSFHPYADHDYSGQVAEVRPVSPLDAISSLPLTIDLIKIDVEGFELRVLQGAADALARSRYLIVEVSLGRAMDGGSNLQIVSFVREQLPEAELVRTGRPFGLKHSPTCEDFIFDLHPAVSCTQQVTAPT